MVREITITWPRRRAYSNVLHFKITLLETDPPVWRRFQGELCRSAVKALTVYLETLTGEDLVPGIIVAVQTFGDRINFPPHLHLLLTEGGVDRAGIFRRFARLDDARLAEIFGREVLALLVGKGLARPVGQSAGEGSSPSSFGSLTQARGRDILIL